MNETDEINARIVQALRRDMYDPGRDSFRRGFEESGLRPYTVGYIHALVERLQRIELNEQGKLKSLLTKPHP